MIGAGEYVLLGFSRHLWELYVAQVLDAAVVAVILGLGVSYAQRLTPARPGAASGLFLATFNIATMLGGMLGALAVPVLGIPRVFLLPAATCALGCAVFLAIDRQAGRLPANDGHARSAIREDR